MQTFLLNQLKGAGLNRNRCNLKKKQLFIEEYKFYHFLHIFFDKSFNYITGFCNKNFNFCKFIVFLHILIVEHKSFPVMGENKLTPPPCPSYPGFQGSQQELGFNDI